jgi:hypothetical protein
MNHMPLKLSMVEVKCNAGALMWRLYFRAIMQIDLPISIVVMIAHTQEGEIK